MRAEPVTTTYTVDFDARPAPRPAVTPTGRVPRVARLLALAYRIDAMVRAGELQDLAHAAKTLGLTRARVTQIMNLLLLAPEIQVALLDLPPVMTGRDPVTERTMRPVVSEPDWEQQKCLWKQIRGEAS